LGNEADKIFCMNSVIDATQTYLENLPENELLFYRIDKHIRVVNIFYPSFATGNMMSCGKRNNNAERIADEMNERLNKIDKMRKLTDILDRKLKSQ
jgi:hypothetical protein